MSFWNPNSLPFVIDWSAWATLIVGIAAVMGAIWVGSRQADIAERQAGIADRQTQILERQTEIAAIQARIEDVRLRSELYDRRLSVFDGLERFVIEAIGNDGKTSKEVRDDLFKSISAARFLLGDEVAELGRQLYTAAVHMRSNVGRLEREKDDDRRSSIIDKISDDHDKISDLYLALQSSMTEYLRLSHP